MPPVLKRENMKDSKLPWIGYIPSHWKIVRIKYLLENVSEKNHPNAMVLSLYRDYGILPKDSRDDNHNVTSLDTASYKFVRSGQLVINKMKAWQGSLGVSDYDGIVSPAYYVCRFISDETDESYFHYLLRCKAYAQEFERLSTGMRIGQWDLGIDDFMCIQAILPPKDEQSAIAAYLDDSCAKIDTIIAETKASIEEYKKWKAAIIFEAVTKGLDPNVEMKDSGVEWIGRIPIGWNICKTLHVLSMAITDGPHTTPELYDTGIAFISAEAVSCGNGYIDFSHKRGYISEEFYQECCKKYIPKINDIYMIKSGATTGRVSMVDDEAMKEKFTIWSPLAVFRTNQNRMLPSYLFYFLQSGAYQKQVELGWSYGTQQNIGMRTLESLKICLPPLNEQSIITAYLDEKCSVIDTLISGKEALICWWRIY